MSDNESLNSLVAKFSTPPPMNAAHGVPIPNSESLGRSPVYRHFHFVDRALLSTIEPHVQSAHDLFELAAQAYRGLDCLGFRKWDSSTKSFQKRYTWISYNEVARRRTNLGAGIVELGRRAGEERDKYGVGIWSQNCVEWHLTGEFLV